MNKMRRKNYWPTAPFLLPGLVLLHFASLAHAQLVKPGVQDPWSSKSLEPSACTFSRQEELITCRGVNHTQLVEELAEIRQQVNDKSQGVRGRNLEEASEDEDAEITLDEPLKNGTKIPNKPNQTRGVRELTIFSCDVPKLTTTNLQTPTNLEILSVVSSGVKEVRPDALSEHAQSLTRLTLAHNFLHALPEALRNLTRLEVLDLSHNEIDHLPEGSLLFNLHRLRQLHLDHNKLGQILVSQARLGLRSPGLSMTVFNLEPLRDSLTQITLAHNAIAAFPEQFARPFTRLSKLDLSSNDISAVLPSGFQEMPRLQYLDLSGNHLQGFNPERISTSLLDLNLRGNPWNCSCDSKWILETFQTNRSESTLITSPTCSSPLHLRHRELSSLKESDICPPKEASLSNKVVYVGDDVDGSLQQALQSLHLLNVTALNHQAVIISWRVDADFYNPKTIVSEPLSWAVTLHETKQDPRSAKVTKMKLSRYKEERPDWRPSESLYTELLHGLDENMQYTLCLVPIKDGHLFTRPDQCLVVTTPANSLHSATTTKSPTTTAPSTTTSEAPKVVPLVSTANYEVETEEISMINENRKVIMSWNVIIHPHLQLNNRVEREAIMLRPLGWKITYRQFADENETEVVLVSRGGEPIQNFTNHYTVEDLEPGTGYTFCFRPLSELEVQASLEGKSGAVYDTASKRHSSTNLEAEVLFSTTRSQQPQGPVRKQIINSVEGDHVIGLGTADVVQPDSTPDFSLQNVPSNIPDAPSNFPKIPSNIPDIPSNFPNIPSNIPDIPSNFPNIPSNFPDVPSNFPNIPSNFPNIPSNIPPVPTSQPYEIEQGIPSSIPPLPGIPNSSPFDRRPPPPPPPPSGGNFVYTSTGERIPIPSSSSGPSSPFNLPSIVGPSIRFDPGGSQWSSPDHPILNIPRSPQQRFTYDFEEDEPPKTESKQTFIYDFTTESSTTTTEKPQRFTYETRRKRSLDKQSKVAYERYLETGGSQFCKEIVTEKEDNIITPVAIASTVSSSTTVIIAIVFCCCCPKRCCRKRAGSGWNGRAKTSNRKISTISNPTPVNVYTRHSSVISGTTVSEDGSRDLKSLSSQVTSNGSHFTEGVPNGQQMKTGRSVSVTSSTGYLTPLPATNGTVPDPDRVFNEAKLYLPSQKAYLNSVKDRLLQQHKDLTEFHPGYDIPPNASIKSLLGYDYPHPTPVNAIGAHSIMGTKPEVPNKTSIPSPSSSDSNYNASVSDPREAELRPEVNLNIPFNQNKSSDFNKKFNLNKDSDLNKSSDYNYINPEDVSSKPRTYIKNAPSKVKHRKFGSPQRYPNEQIAQPLDAQELGKQLYSITPLQSPSHLSRSVPDLATAGRSLENPNSQPADITAAARLNLLIGNREKEGENGMNSLPSMQVPRSSSKSPVPSTSTNDSNEVNGYVNFPSSRSSGNKDQKPNKDRDHYHTWSSSRPNTPRSRPSLGEVVLTGGTLIEVPEGYVIPKPPKPARTVRLLVPGEDKPTELDKSEIKPERKSLEYIPPPVFGNENKTVSSLPPITTPIANSMGKSQITHLMTPELDQNRIVISTGMAV